MTGFVWVGVGVVAVVVGVGVWRWFTAISESGARVHDLYADLRGEKE